LQDGTWYYFYNEFVADEAPFAATTVIATGTNSGTVPLVIDIAEMDWGLVDDQIINHEGLNASFGDSSASPGAATINKSAGRSAIAAGASTVVITNSKVLAASVVLAVLEDGDATATSIRVSAVAAGSFTVTANAAATAATKFRWAVIS
jgi:hypothetical protein